MAVNALQTTTITFTGDINATNTLPAAPNGAAPGSITIHSLIVGNNTITLPTGGSTVLGATIIPPTGNLSTMIVKGIAGDTGIQIHKTNPTSITFDNAAVPANFIITVAVGVINNLRIIWT